MERNLSWKSWTSLALWILIFEIIGFLIGQLTRSNIETWYQGLQKASLTPPSILFPIVWSLLYALLGMTAWIITRRSPLGFSKLKLTFWLQMIMNWTWSFLFFHFHFIQLSFFWLLGIIFFTLLTVYYLPQKIAYLKYLLFVYTGWLLFASYLNGIIWQLN